MNNCELFDFYKRKRVFLTGHTGFKGTWLSRILVNAGAVVLGYSQTPPTEPALFESAELEHHHPSPKSILCKPETNIGHLQVPPPIV